MDNAIKKEYRRKLYHALGEDAATHNSWKTNGKYGKHEPNNVGVFQGLAISALFIRN